MKKKTGNYFRQQSHLGTNLPHFVALDPFFWLTLGQQETPKTNQNHQVAGH